MRYEEIRTIALSFPNVSEHEVFGTPTLRVGKRFFVCIAKIDPNTLCVKVLNPLERDYLLATQPDIYYLTDHYANFEAVLVRMALITRDELFNLLENSWLSLATKKAAAAYKAAKSS